MLTTTLLGLQHLSATEMVNLLYLPANPIKTCMIQERCGGSAWRRHTIDKMNLRSAPVAALIFMYLSKCCLFIMIQDKKGAAHLG